MAFDSTLPDPRTLERTCRGLATLDAMLSAEWELRYFSFNAHWSAGQRMASMRNGSGDEWFFVFGDRWVFFKAFWHEYPPEDVEAVYAGLPDVLLTQRHEPAFSMDQVTFGGFHDGTRWTLRGNPSPLEELWPLLQGRAEAYRAFALEYFERDVPLDAIAHVLAAKPLLESLVIRIDADRSLKALAEDLAEIDYGAAPIS